jgi:hypothetical protein
LLLIFITLILLTLIFRPTFTASLFGPTPNLQPGGPGIFWGVFFP